MLCTIIFLIDVLTMKRLSGVGGGRIMACVAATVFAALCGRGLYAQSLNKLTVHISLGQTSAQREPFEVRLLPSGGARIGNQSVWRGTAGAGHVETQAFDLAYPDLDLQPIQNLHVIWADLIAHSDADTAARLLQDPAARIDPRKIVVELNAEGSRGFTLTVDQLLHHQTFWIPALDVYISTGDTPVSFADSQRSSGQSRRSRVLDQVQRDPEASYEEFRQRWQNMGDPSYMHPEQEGPGHIVGLTWDSAIPKFGIDRGAGVWNDYGNPDHFRFWFSFSNLAEGIVPYWKSQTLDKGLPVITTIFERDHVRYEVEQFAYPLNGPPQQRTGNLKMVLLQRVKMTELTGLARTIPVTMTHERALPPQADTDVIGEHKNGMLLLSEDAHHQAIFEVNAKGAKIDWVGVHENGQKMKRVDVTVLMALPAGGTREFYVTLPSPIADQKDLATLEALNYEAARAGTLQFWSSYLARGAKFSVPEPAVNDLFNANLWHALRLPRRHSMIDIDLPYSNFAYDQTGTPWPINQAVYVDYMLYGLRGYNGIATEEMQAIFHNNQDFNGRVDGFAHWLAYTPGMLYAVAQNYLLSGDRESFEQLLPSILKALDWSITKIRSAVANPDSTGGLVSGPLNDITGTGDWAFNQAYLYAGVDLMGKALAKYGSPRAAECLHIAAAYRTTIEHAIQIATVRSPLVQLGDNTWVPFVPSDASHPGRNYAGWYPSDVDTGPAHLLRLKALPGEGELADAILNDHEDNLFLHQWGLSNEPVYNQQATAYLLRDDAKAAIRTFYSMMAGAFSQGVYEPVEHRWRWGQYFGPPSTDGAWFELYRNMLVREWDDNTLILGQAVPRAWLENGKEISVNNAPTWFGNITFEIKSHADDRHIQANFKLNVPSSGKTVLVRLRHPQNALLRSVMVNGHPWSDFDAKKEWVRIPNVTGQIYQIDATY